MNQKRSDEDSGSSPATRRAPVEMQCELGENTETKLKEMKVHCVEEVIEYYYDTESFLLASTQTWLSQHNGHWRLILEQSQDHNKLEKTKRSGKTHECPPTGGIQPKMINTPSPLARECQQGDVESKQVEDLNEALSQSVQSPAHSCTSAFIAGLRYTELTDHRSIIKQLFQCLPDNLISREIQHISIESFLESTKIRMYDSWIRSRTVKYSLPNGCCLVVETNFNNPTAAPSAVLIRNADVLNINAELEKMERMCTQLDLKIKA